MAGRDAMATHRVVLRRLVAADLAALQSYRHDPEVGRYQGWTPVTDEAALAFILAQPEAPPFPRGEWMQLAIADRETQILIGDIGVCVDEAGATAEIGFTLGRLAQGRGLASEAVALAIELVFATTPVARIMAITDARNLPSVALLERLGFRRVDERNTEFRGEPCIEYDYVIERAARDA